MADYVSVVTEDDNVSVSFFIEDDRIMELGERINAEYEDAYMNGYNWEALLTCYLRRRARGLLNGLETDSEAGMFAAYYEENTPETVDRAHALADLIRDLVEDESELFDFLSEYADEIAWE